MAEIFYRVLVSIHANVPATLELSQQLSMLIIEEASQRPAQLTLQLEDPYKVFSHALQEGMYIEAELGNGAADPVRFSGRIYRIEASFPKQSTPTLKLIAFDHLMSLGLLPRNRRWADMSLSAIITSLAQRNQIMRTDIDADSAQFHIGSNGIRQCEETDLAFLLRLANKYGYHSYLKNEGPIRVLHFKSQYQLMTTEPVATLFYGRQGVEHNLDAFSASVDLGSIPLPCILAGMDYDNGRMLDQVSGQHKQLPTDKDLLLDENLAAYRQDYPLLAEQLRPLLGAAESIRQTLQEELGMQERQVTLGFSQSSDLNFIANNQFTTSLHGMRASGNIIGTPTLRANCTVEIKDVGGRFSGKWYLFQVKHSLDRSGYYTQIECRK